MKAATAFPLAWPPGWPRTNATRSRGYQFREETLRHQFKSRKLVTFETARSKLANELDRMKATDIILSTNIPLRLDGQPRAGANGVNDPGVAIYFTFNGKPMVMACDRYDGPAANCRSLGLAIEALRKLERHGGGVMMERAFAGFAALPPPIKPKRHWRDVLGFASAAKVERHHAEDAFRVLARNRHPDKGGTHDMMSELTVAIREARDELT